MTGSSDTSQLHDYLDGLLAPAEADAFRRRLEGDAALRREAAELSGAVSLLDTSLDVEPPADLLPGIFQAIETARARCFRLPARLEHGLVFAAAAALAAVVVGGTQALGPASSAGTLGRLSAGVLSMIANGVVGMTGALNSVDWMVRTLATLSGAARTVLASGPEPLALLTASAGACTALGAWWLWRRKGIREGGVAHVSLVV